VRVEDFTVLLLKKVREQLAAGIDDEAAGRHSIMSFKMAGEVGHLRVAEEDCDVLDLFRGVKEAGGIAHSQRMDPGMDCRAVSGGHQAFEMPQAYAKVSRELMARVPCYSCCRFPRLRIARISLHGLYPIPAPRPVI
jgi:hypothetical protein